MGLDIGVEGEIYVKDYVQIFRLFTEQMEVLLIVLENIKEILGFGRKGGL